MVHPGDERLLLEVKERRHPGHEEHEHGDSDQIRRAPHLGEGGEHPAPDTPLRTRLGARLGARRPRRRRTRCLTALAADDLHHEEQRHEQQPRGNRQQVDGADRQSELARDERADQPAGARPGPDEAEQAHRLLAAEYIRHQAPESRHHEQVEHAHPHVVGACDPGVIGLYTEPEPEEQQVEDEEPVYPRQEHRARVARGEVAVQRLQQQHYDEHAPEQVRNLVQSRGDAERIAHRTQHGVTGERAQQGRQRRQYRGRFAGLKYDQAPQEFFHDTPLRSWYVLVEKGASRPRGRLVCHSRARRSTAMAA